MSDKYLVEVDDDGKSFRGYKIPNNDNDNDKSGPFWAIVIFFFVIWVTKWIAPIIMLPGVLLTMILDIWVNYESLVWLCLSIILFTVLVLIVCDAINDENYIIIYIVLNVVLSILSFIIYLCFDHFNPWKFCWDAKW